MRLSARQFFLYDMSEDYLLNYEARYRKMKKGIHSLSRILPMAGSGFLAYIIAAIIIPRNPEN